MPPELGALSAEPFLNRPVGASETEFPPDLACFLSAVAAEGLWAPAVVRDHGRHLTLRMAKARLARAASDTAHAHGTFPLSGKASCCTRATRG